MWIILQGLGLFFKLIYYVIEATVLSVIPDKYRHKKNISGQIALVTGAGGGIGRLLALGLASQGCRVVCWDIAKQANEETARLIRQEKGEAHAYQVDLTKKENIYRLAEHVKEDVGKVDILVNNAGVVIGKNLLDCPDELIRRTFDVNILSHFWTVKSFLPDMIAKGNGHIVTLSSALGFAGSNRLIDYCASKFATVGFDESLRLELTVEGRKGIKTTIVCPYAVKTPLFEGIESKIFPVLEPEYVAQKTIQAILNEDLVCLIPGYNYFFVLFKNILPAKAFTDVFEFFGFGDTLKAFQGPKTKFI